MYMQFLLNYLNV